MVVYIWINSYSQTKMYTFNISHIILQFIRYSLENSNKKWQELRVNCGRTNESDNVW